MPEPSPPTAYRSSVNTQAKTPVKAPSVNRNADYHVTTDADGDVYLKKMAEELGFEKVTQALRTLGLAVGGDEKAMKRVAPFLGGFMTRLLSVRAEQREVKS